MYKRIYLCRAVDSGGNTTNLHFSKSKDTKAAKRFFKKALAVRHSTVPHAVTINKNPVYPLIIEQLTAVKMEIKGIKIRRIRYLNNSRTRSLFY
ncbi:DDE-type integrase/transposase/recombinase [Bacillus cereus]|uniref:DDE-type integrase/transposase/recombinase n=1 Tax=Bacillus cereus TaxID=1396 RepID=UPI0015D4CCFA|nr:DDE-type integrase/transposase/recombinase [Bacillus cereus]